MRVSIIVIKSCACFERLMSFQPSEGIGASRRDCGKLGFIIPPKPLLNASATCVRASGISPSIDGKYSFINDWMIGIYRSAKLFEFA